MNETKNNSFKQKHPLKKWCLILSGVVVFFILTAIVSAFIFEDKIADVVLKELYKSVKTDIKHKDISFSLLRKFPMASLQVNNLEVKGRNEKNNILSAKSVFLQFNILDVLTSHYKLKRIEIINASLRLKTFKNGSNNWDIFNEMDSTSQDFSLLLNTIKLQNVSVQYQNNNQHTQIKLLVKKLGAKGNFSEQIFDLALQSNIKLQAFTLDSTLRINNKNIQLSSTIHLNTEKQHYTLKKGDLHIDNFHFSTDIDLQQSPHHLKYAIQLKGNQISLKDVLDEMPASTQKILKKYEPTGLLAFHITAKGTTGKKPTFHTKANFSLAKGSIKNIESNIRLSQIKLKGSFKAANIDLMKSGVLEITQFSALLNNKTVKGNLSLKNLHAPLLSFHLISDVNLEDWQGFMPQNYIYKTKGASSIDIQFKNQFSTFTKLTADDFKTVEISGNITLNNVYFQLGKGETAFDDLNGKLELSNQCIRVVDLNGSVNDNTFLLNGNISNYFDYFFTDQNHMLIEADVSSPYLNLNRFFSKSSSSNASNTKTDNTFKIAFPQRIDLKLSLHINKFVFDAFEGNQIAGSAEWKNRTFTINNLNLNAFGGSVFTSAYAQEIGNNIFSIYCNAKIEGANVQELFHAFNNFGQSETGITDKKIRGTASSNILFKAKAKNDLSIIPQSVDVLANISIDNGQLIHFKPLESLSKFVELEDLQNIRFAHLQNRIAIKDQIITIPEMDVKNNALNLTLSGKQAFNGNMDYAIKLKLNDLLSNKRRAKRKNQDDFGEVVNDGTGNTYIFISASGNLDNPVFKWSRQHTKSEIKDQIKDQKQDFNTIFKQDSIQNKKQQDKDLNDYKKKPAEIEIEDDW